VRKSHGDLASYARSRSACSFSSIAVILRRNVSGSSDTPAATNEEVQGMMSSVLYNVGWVVVLAVTGGIVGMALVMLATLFLPKLIERMTPNLDEEVEITRGNVAVAEYFGRVVAACIIGMSIVVAAAVLGGIIGALC
jgi:hypothetical protein